MLKMLTILAFIAALFGASTPFLAKIFTEINSVQARYIKKLTPDQLKTNRVLFSEGDDEAKYYGSPIGNQDLPIVFYDKDLLVSPTSGPGAGKNFYYIVDNANPIQVQTLWFFARIATAALLFAGGIFFLIASFMAKKTRQHKTQAA